MDNFEEMSSDALRSHLEKIDAEKAALLQALDARKEEEMKSLAAEIKALIIERGFDVEEIADRVLSRKRKASTSGKSSAGYERYADPDNPHQTYLRGRLPNWLSEKMVANGYDPTSPEHRTEFKEKHLVKVAA
jgi:DNA-binding protein H-NS